MKKILATLMVLLILTGFAFAEEEEPTYVYVTATQLNGRDRPSKRGIIEGLYDYGDKLEATGNWSRDYKWIETVGGEAPSVWVSVEYVTERYGPIYFKNEDYNKVKIRKSPVKGKLSGYLNRGSVIEIDRIVMGWGHCSKGWIDLTFLEELENP